VQQDLRLLSRNALIGCLLATAFWRAAPHARADDARRAEHLYAVALQALMDGSSMDDDAPSNVTLRESGATDTPELAAAIALDPLRATLTVPAEASLRSQVDAILARSPQIDVPALLEQLSVRTVTLSADQCPELRSLASGLSKLTLAWPELASHAATARVLSLVVQSTSYSVTLAAIDPRTETYRFVAGAVDDLRACARRVEPAAGVQG
jgi:hypothetical protein